MFRPAIRTIFALFLGAMLTGCAALTAVNNATAPLDVYELRVPPDIQPRKKRSLARDVIIELPTTSGGLSTDRIMIRPNALQAQYLPGSRWSEPTPVMVQTLMLRAIERSGLVRYVGRKPVGVGGDFAILTELVDFQAELDEAGVGATVRLTLLIRVVRESDARIVATRTFSNVATAVSTETDVIVEAFDRASHQVIAGFAEWLAGVIGG
jgi:cholesterol transport system auxiliary component